MTALAAVVITNHDYGRFVGEAIESALAQTVPVEVVVVDDGSTDESLAVIDRYRDRVTVVAKANGGQASAFNAGFAATSAPVVFFLDADDVLTDDAAASVLDALERSPSAVRCQFRLDLIDAAGDRVAGGFPEPGRSLPAGDLTGRLFRQPDDIPWQPTSGNAFRASVLAELLPMPTEPYRISADHFLSNLTPLHGPIVAVERSLGRYRVHGANADHREAFDVARAREILIRTAETHRHLIEHGRAAGFRVPSSSSEFRSLTSAALRLASLRSQPRSGHPFADDRWMTVTAAGLRAAAGRTDLSLGRRLLAVAWIAALAVAPARLVPWLASRGLTR